MPRVLFRFRFGGADGLLCGEPPAVGPAIQVLFQFPQRGLVRLLRSAGAIVVEPDRQLLKGQANLVRLTDAKVASHQIQLSGRQHLLHPLHQQRPTHHAVIGMRMIPTQNLRNSVWNSESGIRIWGSALSSNRVLIRRISFS